MPGADADAAAPATVVAGVDGSPDARAALRWAVLVARLLGDGVTLVHGAGLTTHVGARVVPAHHRLTALRATLDAEWAATPGRGDLVPQVVVQERPAVDAVLAAAHDGPADLVVVGTRGTGLASSQALGSTALQLLARADVPVLVVPPAPDEAHRAPALGRLLVGVDGTPGSDAALDWARRLAAPSGGRCRVLACAEEAPLFPLGPDATTTSAGEEGAPDRLRAMTERSCEPLRAAGLLEEISVLRGPAAPTLVAAATDGDADLVVVGSGGHGSPGDPLRGTVSRQVARAAGRPVLVCPSGPVTPTEGAPAPGAG